MSYRISRRQFLEMTAMLAGAVALESCAAPAPAGGGQTTGQKKTGGTLTIGANQAAPQLDPHVVTYAFERTYFAGLYNGLTEYDEDMNVVPALAEKWEFSPDLKTYTWYLRKGVKFHNGREVVADDIKWNYERCLDPKLGSQMRNNVQEVEKIEVVDKYTVKMYLNTPSVTLPMGAQELKIIPKEALDNINKNAVGTGPYMFDDFVPNERLSLKRFDGYWGGKPNLDKVIITAIKDQTAAMNAFKSGQWDVIWQISPKDAVTLKDDPKVKLLLAKVSSANYFWEPDTTSPPFDNQMVRQAFCYAIPRQEIVDVALFGYGKPSWTNNFVPEGHWAFNPNLIRYDYNLDKAKELFTKAGIKEGTEFVWWTLAGILPEFTTFGEIMAQSLAKIGLKLKIEQNEVGKWVDAFYPSGKKFPNLVVPNGDTAALDPAFPLKFFAQKRCECNYNDPKIDELLAQGKSTADKEKRKQAYWEIQKIVNEVVPAFIPCSWLFTNGAQKYVEGVWIESGGQIHYQDAWLNK
jgi:peptide/nickel transport system substrate-binding protein